MTHSRLRITPFLFLAVTALLLVPVFKAIAVGLWILGGLSLLLALFTALSRWLHLLPDNPGKQRNNRAGAR